MKHPNASKYPDPFVAGAMTELEAHWKFLGSRITKFNSPVMTVRKPGTSNELLVIRQQVFDELLRHIQQLEKRRAKYPKMKEPARITTLRTKHARKS